MYVGKMTIVIDDDLEEEFRRLVALKYGTRKGVLGAAISEAIKTWIRKTKKELENAD
ncbi:hypothetical protein [Thermococcus litoralis]|uniref:hypothetical protein n=1 Tax=Thermococcus litoralis TaxID=2265 RepID=UPI001C4F16EB|nr:hypothetical protein [Thermococcus litoralis]